MPNTTYLGIGDFFILFNTEEIRKDEEITCNYDNTSLTFKDRQKELLNSWGFKCKCKLCEYQEKNNYSYYDNFIKLFYPNANVNISPEIIGALEKFLKENEKNYSSYDLANAYLQLENLSSQSKDLSITQKYSDLVTKYTEEKHYLFKLTNIYKCFDSMKNIEDFISKNSPFITEEIHCFIIDNIQKCTKK